jgi:hypothetical protein
LGLRLPGHALAVPTLTACVFISTRYLAQEKELPKEKDATLWDCEELALRYVLEDGKLNL